MKETRTFLGIIAILAMIGFGLTACETDPCADCFAIGATGEGGGIIIYHDHAGFTVTGLGTCYYLEAAPTNQTTSVTWSSSANTIYVNVTGATGTAIGTGKANTAAIIAAHSSDTASNNAAKAAVAYPGGGKSDWFLPSREELSEMCKARDHLGISGSFWSSSQHSTNAAFSEYCGYGTHGTDNKETLRNVRAIRAF